VKARGTETVERDGPLAWIQTKRDLLRTFSPHACYLIGVSGGRDSVALLHQLVDLGYKNLVVCHLNHRLRGRLGATDARFVQNLADKYDLEVKIGSANVRALAASKKMSIETAARFARYKFFSSVAGQKQCRTIFLAHHADDLVETFLLNLFRGAGTSGLSAMRAVSIRKIDNVKLEIVRPFLCVWRSDIDKYVRKHRLAFREDPSNKNLTPQRNRIRRQIIPYIERTVGRNVRESIWRAATIVSEEENFFEELVPDRPLKRTALAVKPLQLMPIALQRRMLHRWLRKADVPDVSFELVERVRALIALACHTARTNLPRDRHVRRRAGKLLIE
jgi:tRNA(Ile)-lysidine synthase